MFLCIISSSPGLANTPPVIISAAGRAGLPSNETSLASIASRAGYRTAAIGKWHLGMNDLTWGDQQHGPLGHGFQYYYGLPFTLVDEFVSEVRQDIFSSQCRT